MDEQLFESLINGPGPAGSPDQSAMISELRNQKQIGDFLSMGSSEVAPRGQEMVKGALNSARDIGDRRQQGLTRTRQAEQDSLAAGQLKRDLANFTDREWTEIKGEDGEVKQVETGVNPSTGRREIMPETEGMTPYDKYAKRKLGAGAQGWRSGELASGAPIQMNTMTGEIFAFGEKYKDKAAFQAAHPDEQLNEESAAKTELARATSFGSKSGERDEERIESAFEAADMSEVLSDDYGQMIKLLDEGAKTGVLYDVLPSFTAATKAFESYKDKLTLNNLKKWKLTPVSDKDIKYLSSASLANVPPEEMRNYLVYQQEASRRIAAGEAVMADYLERNNGRRPRGADAKALQDEIQAVVYAPGFEWPSQGGGPAYAMTGGESEAPAAGVGRPEFVPQSDWDSYSPEQQKALAE
jgi:hypothetical protein